MCLLAGVDIRELVNKIRSSNSLDFEKSIVTFCPFSSVWLFSKNGEVISPQIFGHRKAGSSADFEMETPRAPGALGMIRRHGRRFPGPATCGATKLAYAYQVFKDNKLQMSFFKHGYKLPSTQNRPEPSSYSQPLKFSCK